MEIIHGYCRKVEKRKLGLTAGVHGKLTMLGHSGGMEFTLLQYEVPLVIEDDSDKDNNTFKKLQRQLRVHLRPLKGLLTQSAVTVLRILDESFSKKYGNLERSLRCGIRGLSVCVAHQDT